ncbi:MAG TPA: LemA family protein [Armatimonadota bacterium]|jgi:LemA protein
MHNTDLGSLMAVGAPILLVIVWFGVTYNHLVKLRNLVPESWSNVDTELRRRYELIPNLVKVVKGYTAHESQIMESVVAARSKAMQACCGTDQQAREESDLVRSLRSLLAVAEGYPDLKADQEFTNLQHELVRTEDRIQAARRFYNSNVRDLNTLIQSFPSSIIAGVFGFTRAKYYEIEEVFASQLSSITFSS